MSVQFEVLGLDLLAAVIRKAQHSYGNLLAIHRGPLINHPKDLSTSLTFNRDFLAKYIALVRLNRSQGCARGQCLSRA